MERLYVEKGRLTAGGVPVLLRGFGLGGWLLPEGYMWRFYTKCDRPRRIEALIEKLCGAEYAASFWERYYGSYITEADIRLAAQNGFNSVRLPFNARHLREPGYLRCIDDCVRWCGKHGVYAILDMHAAPGGQTGQNIDDSERDLPELFMRPEHRDELCALWALLAARYRGEAAVAGFDLLNEPLIRKDAEHNGRLVPLYLRITEAVRRADPGAHRHLGGRTLGDRLLRVRRAGERGPAGKTSCSSSTSTGARPTRRASAVFSVRPGGWSCRSIAASRARTTWTGTPPCSRCWTGSA